MGTSQIHDDGGIIKKVPETIIPTSLNCFTKKLVKHSWVCTASKNAKWITKFAKQNIFLHNFLLPAINFTQQLPLILVNHVNMFQALILEDISPLENSTDTHWLYLHTKWGV